MKNFLTAEAARAIILQNSKCDDFLYAILNNIKRECLRKKYKLEVTTSNGRCAMLTKYEVDKLIELGYKVFIKKNIFGRMIGYSIFW